MYSIYRSIMIYLSIVQIPIYSMAGALRGCNGAFGAWIGGGRPPKLTLESVLRRATFNPWDIMCISWVYHYSIS